MKIQNNFYIQLEGPLFERVQLTPLFSDSKIFVDAYPKMNPEELLVLFKKKCQEKHFDLKRFVLKHFTLPQEEKNYVSQACSLKDHIFQMWEILEKDMKPKSPYSTLIELPKPHIVPGGRFRECFYWDSYFVSLGLATSNQLKKIENMAINFAFLLDCFGLIPNGNRIYFLSRSQPPYFSYLLELLLQHKKEEKEVLKFMPQLEAEYHYWMRGKEKLSQEKKVECSCVLIDEKTILNRFFDPLNTPRPEAFLREITLFKGKPFLSSYQNLRSACASGWDFSSRWFANPKKFETICALNILPVDLNCALYHLEKMLALFAEKRHEAKKHRKYAHLASKRKEAIDKIFYSKEKAFYFDYHFKEKKHTPYYTLAAMSPLFAAIAPKDKAEAVIQKIEKYFLFPGGFTTTLLKTTHQWDHPNGWAPLQWITIKGLLNYGKEALAKQGAQRWLQLNQKIFNQKKTLLEKYNVAKSSSHVAKGEYALQEGFGWTNGVHLALLDLFHLNH